MAKIQIHIVFPIWNIVNSDLGLALSSAVWLRLACNCRIQFLTKIEIVKLKVLLWKLQWQKYQRLLIPCLLPVIKSKHPKWLKKVLIDHDLEKLVELKYTINLWYYKDYLVLQHQYKLEEIFPWFHKKLLVKCLHWHQSSQQWPKKRSESPFAIHRYWFRQKHQSKKKDQINGKNS